MSAKRLSSVPADVSMYFYMRLVTDDETIGDEWYRFKMMAGMPPCSKHGYPTRDLELRASSLCHSFEIVTIGLRTVFATLPDNEQLNLNPAWWNRVRRDLSEDQCYTSWMGMGQGRASLTDGRHRIVMMMKFLELEYAKFAVQPEHIATARAQVKTRRREPLCEQLRKGHDKEPNSRTKDRLWKRHDLSSQGRRGIGRWQARRPRYH